MKLFDCTLRDGANVVGNGFSAELTTLMLKGLIDNGITLIEMGNALGLGAYDAQNIIAPCTDAEYLQVVKNFLPQAEIGMFIGVKNAIPKYIDLAAENRLNFLRVGANAGDGKTTVDGIHYIRKRGINAHYSLMKAYILSPEELAEEAKMLEGEGLDSITIMDSAGFMTPNDTGKYVSEMVKAVKIPVGFHSHNNLGLSMGNTLIAIEAGAEIIDCSLLGMARSAGNLPTEIIVAYLQRENKLNEIDFYGLLKFLDNELIPAMKQYDYKPAIIPLELIYGLSGCHSSFEKLFTESAKANKVDLYRLIMEVSAIDKKAPSVELINKVASIKNQ